LNPVTSMGSTSPDSSLSAAVRRQEEEERRYSLEKGRLVGVPTVPSSPLRPLAPQFVPEPWSDKAQVPFMCGSPSMTPLPALSDDASMHDAGAIFITRYSRRSSTSYAPPCGAHTSVPDRHLTPGPGSYAPDPRRAMTSILGVTADVPQPFFRSRTNRFGGHLDTFSGADPIHLYPGAQRPRDMSSFSQPSPTTFRRGQGHVSFAAPP